MLDISIRLVIHNIASIISTVALLGMGLFALLNNKKDATNIAFSLTMFFAAVFTTSHVIGVNIIDPVISQYILMFNLVMFLLGPANIHAALALTKKDIEHKFFIIFMYLSGLLFIILFLMSPDIFLLPSTPKMYFPNYYVPGIGNWIRMVFLFALCIPYMIYILVKSYKNTIGEIDRNQYKYFAIMIVSGYTIGIMPNFLVYNIPIDPVIGMSFALILSIPFLFGSVKYNLFNIQVIAKQAFFYGVAVAIVGGIITLLNYSHVLVVNYFPNYPLWLTASISSILSVTIGVIVWKHTRKGDLLKYEFITTVSHKFRTPLTGIKWATENLKTFDIPPKALEQIEYIKNSNEKLVELTDLLINTSSSENDSYRYNFSKENISEEVEKVLKSLNKQIDTEKRNLIINIEPNIKALCDKTRIRFVIQSLIENAIHYTKEGESISINLKIIKNEIVFSVHDNGIGIDKKELSFIFEKFYRTSEARTTDTEGMGIGLFIAKEIIKHHKGKIWVESEGIDKGSTFYFSLPIIK